MTSDTLSSIVFPHHQQQNGVFTDEADGNQFMTVVPFLNPDIAIMTDDLPQRLFLSADIGKHFSVKFVNLFHCCWESLPYSLAKIILFLVSLVDIDKKRYLCAQIE